MAGIHDGLAPMLDAFTSPTPEKEPTDIEYAAALDKIVRQQKC